jgi:hypothetical protein
MTIVRCPRCRDEVSVPVKATSRALVRCPLCLEQYLLAEALAGAPPALVIIGGEVEQAAIQPADSDGIEYGVAGGLSANEFAGRAPFASPVMPARPIVRPLARPRKKEKSGLVLLVNYVVGGVLGLALGLLLLWWGFRRDPLELGPTVAEYAPWIVPAKFQAKAPSGGVTSAQTPGVVGGVAGGERQDATKGPTAKTPSEPEVEEAAEFPLRGGLGGAREPMPDLRDLLPDGPAEEAGPSP